MKRREFVKCVSAAGAALGGMCPSAMSADRPCQTDAGKTAGECPSLTLRPYRLLCVVCSIGEESGAGGDEKLKRVRDAIRQNPDIPLKLVCNVGDVFVYQDPGPEDDRHGSADFNRKRDLEVLQRLDLPPGITLPARIILHRLWDRIESVSGICGCDEVTSEAWKGCPKAKSGFYEKGRKLCLSFAVPGCGSQLGFSEADVPKARNALIVPRTREERDEAKRKSLEAMYRADVIPVLPHNLQNAVSQYGGGVGPGSAEDNLPEIIRLVIKKPEVTIKLVDNPPWMTCAPCPSWIPKLGGCVNLKGRAGLTHVLEDLRVLQLLGLKFGDVMNARELFRLVFERAHPSKYLNWTSPPGSLWYYSGLSPANGFPSYDKGREMLMKAFAFNR